MPSSLRNVPTVRNGDLSWPGQPLMSWGLSILTGVVVGLLAAVLAVPAAEGLAGVLHYTAGYSAAFFVIEVMIVTFLLGSVIAMGLARRFGAPGGIGFLAGASTAAFTVWVLVILGSASLGWYLHEPAPRITGRAIALAVEFRLAPGTPRPEPESERDLGWSFYPRDRFGDFTEGLPRFEEMREEDGRLIVPGAAELRWPGPELTLRAVWRGTSQMFRLTIPERPVAFENQWSAWIEPAPPYQPIESLARRAGRELELRFRLVPYEPYEQPPRLPPRHHRPPTEDEPTGLLLTRIAEGTPSPVLRAALHIARQRPDFVDQLSTLILSPDAIVAQEAMRALNSLDDVPPELAIAVRARAADVVRIANAVRSDPNARPTFGSRASPLAEGVMQAARPLWRAGADIRDALRDLAVAGRDGEWVSSISYAADLIANDLDRLEREGRRQ